MIYLQLVLAFAKRYWKALVLSAILIGIALFVMSWHNRGLRAERAEAKLKEATQLAQKWHDVAQHCSAGVLKLEEENKQFKIKLDEALSRPPQTVIRYKERIVDLSGLVLAPDCTTAVVQIADFLKASPMCEVTP